MASLGGRPQHSGLHRVGAALPGAGYRRPAGFRGRPGGHAARWGPDGLHSRPAGGRVRHPAGGRLLRGHLGPGGHPRREPPAAAAGHRPGAPAGRDGEPAAPGGRAGGDTRHRASRRARHGGGPGAGHGPIGLRRHPPHRQGPARRDRGGHAGDRRGRADRPGGIRDRDFGPDPAHHRSHHAGGRAGGAHRRDGHPHRARRRAPAAGDVQHQRRPHRGGPAGDRRRPLPGRHPGGPGRRGRRGRGRVLADHQGGSRGGAVPGGLRQGAGVHQRPGRLARREKRTIRSSPPWRPPPRLGTGPGSGTTTSP